MWIKRPNPWKWIGTIVDEKGNIIDSYKNLQLQDNKLKDVLALYKSYELAITIAYNVYDYEKFS